MKWKANLIRIALVLLLIVFGVYLYKIGKERDIFFDNKEIALDGQTYSVTSSYFVYVDGKKVGELYQDGRQATMLINGKHKIVLESLTEDGESTGQKVEYSFSMGKGGCILNVPAMLGGVKNFILPPEPVE